MSIESQECWNIRLQLTGLKALARFSMGRLKCSVPSARRRETPSSSGGRRVGIRVHDYDDPIQSTTSTHRTASFSHTVLTF